MSQERSERAEALIGTRHLPAGQKRMRELTDEARAYHALTPYPYYYFRNWKVEDRGPLPVCMPVARDIVKRGARWLFGNPVQLSCPANPRWEAFCRAAWAQNRMDSRLVALAERAGLEGGVALKFSYDAQAEPALRIQTLSVIDEVRLYPDPHDREQLLMARVQYPYYDAAQGRAFWYREEWTDAWEVHYEPLPAEGLAAESPRADPDGATWVESSRTPNRFGVIPLVYIRNLETDDWWGAADLWSPADGDGLYRVLDRINITRFLQDRSNQFDGEINAWLIDAEVDDADIDRPVQPGQPILVETSDAAQAQGQQAKVAFPSGGNALRAAMSEFVADLAKDLRSAASSTYIDQADITNKGNLTAAVLQQIYLPQIEITNEKRKSWGADGLARFLALCARGLNNAGVDLGGGATDVVVRWPDHFTLTEEEKAAKAARLGDEVSRGFLTRRRAVEALAHMDGIEDVDRLLRELGEA